MANTTYKDLASSFFNKIKDYDFISMNEETAYEIAISYIPSACNLFQSCTQDLDNRNDRRQKFNFCLNSANYNILVNYMVIEYLDSNYLRTSMALKSRLSTADFHALKLDSQLGKVMELRSLLKNENDKLAINKSYRDSNLFDNVVNRKKVQL